MNRRNPIGISTLTLAISGVAGLLLIGLPALPAVAAPEEDSKTSYDAVEPMDSTNLKLVEGLDAQGECLFRSAVYPGSRTPFSTSRVASTPSRNISVCVSSACSLRQLMATEQCWPWLQPRHCASHSKQCEPQWKP